MTDLGTSEMVACEMATLRAGQLRVEAMGCTDLERLGEIVAEMHVINDGLRGIREDQIMRRLTPQKRKRWWRR